MVTAAAMARSLRLTFGGGKQKVGGGNPHTRYGACG
jgi:hypothetical protein